MATSCVVEAHREVNDEDRVTSYTLEEMDGEICKNNRNILFLHFFFTFSSLRML